MQIMNPSYTDEETMDAVISFAFIYRIMVYEFKEYKYQHLHILMKIYFSLHSKLIRNLYYQLLYVLQTISSSINQLCKIYSI